MSNGFAFIPNRLTVAHRFELNIFPLNVLFMSAKIENGVRISGTALYEPDLSSYTDDGRTQRLVYFNKHERDLDNGRDWWLEIRFDQQTRQYRGTKYCREEAVRIAGDTHPSVDAHWHRFFISFTKDGLSNGEKCKFSQQSL